MKLIVFAACLMVAAAQEYYEAPYVQEISEDDLVPHFGIHPRFRRDVRIEPNGDITGDHKLGGGKVFGTLGSNDAGLFGRGGYERNIFNDGRGRLDAQAHGTRTLGPYGDSSSLGGALKWKNDNAAASFDINKQIHGSTSWTAAGGGHWPVGKNGDFGLEGTYSRMGGMKDYGGRGVFNYRW